MRKQKLLTGCLIIGIVVVTAYSFLLIRKKHNHVNGKYLFSEDWFSGNIPSWNTIFQELKGKPDLRYLELGVYEGRSFFWMMDNVLYDPSCRAVGIDTFYVSVNPLTNAKLKDVFFHNLKISNSENKVQVKIGFSQKILKTLPEKYFDIIYIDADHRAYSVLTDAILCWPLLKKNGILVFDDYMLQDKYTKMTSDPDTLVPRPVIDLFVYAFRGSLDIVRQGSQYVIRKKDYLEWER